ncbi:MAG: DUF58 domain-containing protein [Calothrix sp. SM1_5_4]|nr:DUF58 domain-containing protein [Calothrix sp. SM1_5_4]
MLEKLRRKLVRENRIYIMPSLHGYLYLAAVIVLILTAATYNNNLIFILAFFMFAIYVVSMLQTHYALKGVRLDFLGAEDAFEGERMTLIFHLQLARPRAKKGLLIRTRSRRFVTVKRGREEISALEPYKPARIEVTARQRGIFPLPEIILETYYPLGLFRAWKVFRPRGELVVYPRPDGQRALAPVQYEHGDEDLGLRSSPEGDFGELRNYLPGESYHQIAWKHYARTGELYRKVHWGAEKKHYLIPWDPSVGQDVEAYLRQMSCWVVKAVEEDASFEMETPASKIEPGRGPEQAKTCLRALAQVKAAA